eukprot:CAMPEP_0174260884 /NCGR_PEP_ID=MMETSP0439-20130205/10901_1 /TAXON_ID=0 /ORGANISM="Stereomyxa ramosa, Strain Chinc5" /LENGTH=466 /DNA_ID=CAMNT_0015345253 /DNA_START=135 /DNA_END=1535 /DNA_ORIENTATION=-
MVIETKDEVCLKVANISEFDSQAFERLRNEIHAMQISEHKNLVPFYGSFLVMQELWMVTEFQSGGTAIDIMNYLRAKDDPLETAIATILKGTLKGLNYIHNGGRLHRNIKAGHILINGDGTVKIADFSVSGWMLEEGRKEMKNSFTGDASLCWMAPEVMERKGGYGPAADIWSLGITALELVAGVPPFAQKPPMKVIMSVLAPDFIPPTLDVSSGKYSKSFKDMIDCSLKVNPAERPTAAKLLKHPFLKKSRDKVFMYDIIKNLPPLGERFKAKIQNENSALKDNIKMINNNTDTVDFILSPRQPKNNVSTVRFDDPTLSASQKNLISFDSDEPVVPAQTNSTPKDATPEDEVSSEGEETKENGVCCAELYLGESEDDFVVFLRTAPGTKLQIYTKNSSQLVIAGKLPPIPDLPGVTMISPVQKKFKKIFDVGVELEPSSISQERVDSTIVIRVRKFKKLKQFIIV